jgi:hypothetical protein
MPAISTANIQEYFRNDNDRPKNDRPKFVMFFSFFDAPYTSTSIEILAMKRNPSLVHEHQFQKSGSGLPIEGSCRRWHVGKPMQF